MTTDQAPAQGTVPLRTDYELKFIAFQMATKYLMQRPPKEHPLTQMIQEVLIKMRDECDAKIANLQAAYDLRGTHLNAAQQRIEQLEGAILAGGATLRQIRDTRGDGRL